MIMAPGSNLCEVKLAATRVGVSSRIGTFALILLRYSGARV
jgi:hypothetical protein